MCTISLIDLLLCSWYYWDRWLKFLNQWCVFYLVTSMNIEKGIRLRFLVANGVSSDWHIGYHLLRRSIAEMTIILSFFHLAIRHWWLLILCVLVVYWRLTFRICYRKMFLFATNRMTRGSLLNLFEFRWLLQKWWWFTISTWAHYLLGDILKILSSLLFKTFFYSVWWTWWGLYVWTHITILSSKSVAL